MSILRGPQRGQNGMTLVELLVTIAILGIISFALTQSMILGFRTTQGTGSRVSNSAAAQSMASHLTADVQSADLVFSEEDPADTCATSETFLHLRWTERSVVLAATTTSTSTTSSTSTTVAGPPAAQTELREVAHQVSYSLDPNLDGWNILRWTCTNLNPDPDFKIVGHVSNDGLSEPVEVFCDTDLDNVTDNVCPTAPPTAPTDGRSPTVRLSTEPDTEADDLVIRRRNP